MIDQLRTDIRYALRQMGRAPLFTLVASLSLGVGITVAASAFSLLNALLFKPLPVPDPGGIYHVYTSRFNGTEFPYGRSSYEDFQDFSRGGVFATLAAHLDWRLTVASGDRSPITARVGFVSPNFFQALGLRLRLGTPFSAEGHNSQIIISERYWQRAFDADPGVVGATMVVNKIPFTVIGVAPAAFRGLDPATTAVIGWLPAPLLPLVTRDTTLMKSRSGSGRFFEIVGRLTPGTTVASATARLAATARELTELYPRAWIDVNQRPKRISILTHRQSVVPPGDGLIIVLATATGLVLFVLLLACTNVAGLLLARAIARRHEIAVRLTLGASRPRLMRQLLTESVLLAGVGGTLGFFGTLWTVQLVSRYPVFDSFDLDPDWRVLLATCGVTLFCALLFGLTPARDALRVDLRSGLTGRAGAGEKGQSRGALIALQVSISCVFILLAFSAGRGVRSKLYTDSGIDVDGLLLVQLDLLRFRRDSVRRVQYIETAREALSSPRGVERVTTTMRLPLSASEEGWSTTLKLPDGTRTGIHNHSVGENYFETVGIRLLGGRTIQESDTRPGTGVAVVNRAFATTYGGNVIGMTVTIGTKHDLLIVGMVDDVRHHTLAEDGRPYIYEAEKRTLWNNAYRNNLIARVSPGMERTVTAEFTRRMRDRYPDAVPPVVETLRANLERWIAPQRVIARITLGIGGVELLLATIGLYSMLLFALLARSREIGVRMALGAAPRAATWAVMADGLRYAAIGYAGGLALCVPAAIFAGKAFMGARATDPVPFVTAFGAVFVASLAAALIPAWRASRIQPATALRHD